MVQGDPLLGEAERLSLLVEDRKARPVDFEDGGDDDRGGQPYRDEKGQDSGGGAPGTFRSGTLPPETYD